MSSKMSSKSERAASGNVDGTLSEPMSMKESSWGKSKRFYKSDNIFQCLYVHNAHLIYRTRISFSWTFELSILKGTI